MLRVVGERDAGSSLKVNLGSTETEDDFVPS